MFTCFIFCDEYCWKKNVHNLSLYFIRTLKVNWIDYHILHPCFTETYTQWDPRPHWKNKPRIRPRWRKALQNLSHWEKWSITIPTVKFWSKFAAPTGFFGLKTMEINILSYEIKGIFIPTGIFVLNFIPVGDKISTGSVRQEFYIGKFLKKYLNRITRVTCT